MLDSRPVQELPGANLDPAKMPGHWLLARMGKRVLRPGGRELTGAMLRALDVRSNDRVVEFAPGLGATARLVIARNPASYVGVDRDAAAVRVTEKILRPNIDRCQRGTAARTGLDDESASVVYGEAMLTMQSGTHKKAIVQEARRILADGGRYGIHELALTPDALAEPTRREIEKALCDSIHVGARPLTVADWKRLLEDEGFAIVGESIAPMRLLEPGRLLADEGLLGVLRLGVNLARHRVARERILAMRAVFQRYEANMCAVALVAEKRTISFCGDAASDEPIAPEVPST